MHFSLLDAAAARAASDPEGAIDSLEWLADALRRDGEASRFLSWGRSSVIDENTGTAVIPRPLFEALHARTGATGRWPVGNAGVLHVYGYLLSREPTPYGLKRQRWLDGDLAEAYGLSRDAFLPWIGEDTLLQRVTSAARRLLAGSTVHREQIGDLLTRVALGRADDDERGPWALAYAIDAGAGEKLVTTFPVADRAALLAGVASSPPRLRWNAIA